MPLTHPPDLVFIFTLALTSPSYSASSFSHSLPVLLFIFTLALTSPSYSASSFSHSLPVLLFIFTLSLTSRLTLHLYSLASSLPVLLFIFTLTLTSPSYSSSSLSHLLPRLTLHLHSHTYFPVLLFIFTLSLTHFPSYSSASLSHLLPRLTLHLHSLAYSFPRLSIPASGSVILLQPAAYHTTGHVAQRLSLHGTRLVLSCLDRCPDRGLGNRVPGTPSARSN